MRLAIIGAGVSGCSAAYFAHNLIPSSEITVYERSNRVGGRVYDIDFDGKKVEIGAAFFKNGHQLLIGILRELGIKANPINPPASFGVWNGEKFIQKNSHALLAVLNIFLRNLLSILRIYVIMREWERRNKVIYQEVKNHPGEWDELFEAARVTEWLKRSLRDVLLERGVNPGFINEIVDPIIRVIYNQDSSINAYAGLSVLNLLRGRTYHLESGNELIPKRLIEASGAILKTGVEVERITIGENESYVVAGPDFSDEFDSIIIANHDLRNLLVERSLPAECSLRKFQQVFVQIVRGELNQPYFDLHPNEKSPNTIISTKEVPFTHIIDLESSGVPPVYSVASTKPIDFLDDIFDAPEVIFQHEWAKAYPVLEPLQKMPKCRLGKRLFYAGCSESAISAMEASILSAFNSVLLLRLELGENSSPR